MRKVLLGIDLQYDFCNPLGALSVKGADTDVRNIAKLIRNNANTIDGIIMSMDSHQPIHIAHQIYWKNKEGNHPEFFSTIKRQDVENGKWIAQYNKDEALDYLEKLESRGGVCTIWPPHCIIGTKGWSIDSVVFDSVRDWSIASGLSYELINKGMHQSSEHYSIFKAAVEYPQIKSTLFNSELIDRLSQFDQILIVGEAADFCVANSLKDLLERAPQLASKICMLTDCMSYIVEGSKAAENIFAKAAKQGVVFCKSIDF